MIIQATALRIPLRRYQAKLVYCDPPRNMQMNEGNSCDDLPPLEYEEFIIKWLREAYRCLSIEGWLVICTYHKQRWFYEKILSENYGELKFDCEVIWDYNFGLYTHKRWVPSHDNILIYKRGSPHFYWNQVAIESQRLKAGDPRADARGRTPSSVWAIPRVSGNSKQRSYMVDINRRTCQPIELTARILKAFTEEGDTILDLFCGSGSMALVAKTYSRYYLGIDICHHYCTEAQRRHDNDWLRIWNK